MERLEGMFLDPPRKFGSDFTARPLHGLPILIKNNIATNDQMNNTAGSWSLVGAKVPRDSTMAAKLRKAGAIILGKTNLSQWANYRSFNSSNGWSAQGGQTYGAYYLGQDPSGSSSGSGVASSIGLAFGSLGTETDGSILSPSQLNNIVGIKPTVGLTSRSLVIPISEHQDTVGPMARTVKDAAYILQAIAGPDSYDNYTSVIPWANSTVPDYPAACQFDALLGKRIGVPRNAIGTPSRSTAPIYAAFEAALNTLRSAGAIIVENTNYTAFDQYLESSAEDTVLSGDFGPNLAAYLAQLTYNTNDVNDLSDVRNFTQNILQLNRRPHIRPHLLPHQRALLERIRKPNQTLLTPIITSERQSKRNIRRRGIQITASVGYHRSITRIRSQRHRDHGPANNRRNTRRVPRRKNHGVEIVCCQGT